MVYSIEYMESGIYKLWDIAWSREISLYYEILLKVHIVRIHEFSPFLVPVEEQS